MNPGDRYNQETESKEVDYADENKEITEKQSLVKNQDSKYVTSTVLDLPDTTILAKPISKIFWHSRAQLCVYHYNTDCFTPVDRTTLAIKDSVQLQGLHLPSTSSITVLDVKSNC